MLHARERLSLSAKGFECLPFQIQKVLFRRSRWPCDTPSAHHVCQFASNVGFVFGDVSCLLHEINPELQFSAKRFAEDWNFSWNGRTIAGAASSNTTAFAS